MRALIGWGLIGIPDISYLVSSGISDYIYNMDWSKVKATPKYNPHMFELCRCLDGVPRYKFAKLAGMTTKRYSAIESGDVVPTEIEFQGILGAQTHVIASFFEQWPEYELDMSGPLAKNVPIDYYKYKVFRDMNPPRMAVIK